MTVIATGTPLWLARALSRWCGLLCAYPALSQFSLSPPPSPLALGVSLMFGVAVYLQVFLLACTVSIIDVAYIFFFVPESLGYGTSTSLGPISLVFTSPIPHYMRCVMCSAK